MSVDSGDKMDFLTQSQWAEFEDASEMPSDDLVDKTVHGLFKALEAIRLCADGANVDNIGLMKVSIKYQCDQFLK